MFQELAKEERHSVPEELFWQVLPAFFVLADNTGNSSHVVLEDAFNFILSFAERTFDRQLCNRTISQASLRF